MSKVQEGLLYSESHEWVRVEGPNAFVGISDFAQEEMGDITYVDLPDLDNVLKGEEFGALESVKASSDLYSPVTGTVSERNTDLENAPELLNEDPYGSWIIRIHMSNPAELDELMDAEAYAKFIGQ
ncbi:MAG: glycine cleavage system protein GcvH [Bacteroidales bacterium]|nr:glycine cleavage system protein GcvH [Bacteroidales bacterium]